MISYTVYNMIYKVQNQWKAVVMSHPWCVLIIHHLSMIKQKSSSFSLCKILCLVYVGVYRYWKVKRERVVSHGLYKTEGFIVIKVWKPNRIVLRLAFIYNLYSLYLCHWLTAMIRTVRISNSLKNLVHHICRSALSVDISIVYSFYCMLYTV